MTKNGKKHTPFTATCTRNNWMAIHVKAVPLHWLHKFSQKLLNIPEQHGGRKFYFIVINFFYFSLLQASCCVPSQYIILCLRMALNVRIHLDFECTFVMHAFCISNFGYLPQFFLKNLVSLWRLCKLKYVRTAKVWFC